jgi:hypothetical protein
MKQVLSSLAVLLACAFGNAAFAQAAQAEPAAPPTAGAGSAAEAGAGSSRTTAAAAHRKAEHERIRHERDAIKAQRVKDEAVCYQRFAVEDCLKAVRAQVRDAETRLRLQEIDLNDAERKEKAAERLKSIEEKQRPVPASAAVGGGPDAVMRKPAAAHPQASQAQRDHDAQLRAQEQRSKVQKQAQEQKSRAAESADRAAQARARHAETLKAAEEHRARMEKSRADAAAQGRKPAAPLPPASAAR